MFVSIRVYARVLVSLDQWLSTNQHLMTRLCQQKLVGWQQVLPSYGVWPRRQSLVIPWGLECNCDMECVTAGKAGKFWTYDHDHCPKMSECVGFLQKRAATPQVSTLQVDVEKAEFQQRAVEIAEQLLCCQGQSIYGRRVGRATVQQSSIRLEWLIGCPLSIKGTSKIKWSDMYLCTKLHVVKCRLDMIRSEKTRLFAW